MIRCGKYRFAVIKCGFVGQDTKRYLLYSIVEYLQYTVVEPQNEIRPLTFLWKYIMAKGHC